MILCDVGNTTFHFCKDSMTERFFIDDYQFEPSDQTIYFICVNQKILSLTRNFSNWINLDKVIDKSQYYTTMGVDRIAGCEAVNNGVIIDVGSAITVDIVSSGNFKGGYICLGLDQSRQSYLNISPQLDYSYNFEQNFDKIPKNSRDAITYAQLGLLYKDVLSYNLPIYLTGGNSIKLKSVFKKAIIDDKLIFKGMKNIMKKVHLC